MYKKSPFGRYFSYQRRFFYGKYLVFEQYPQAFFACEGSRGERRQSVESFYSELDCSVGSVRNYYYSQAKLFKMIPSLATEMGIEQAITRARPFVTFDPEEAETILVNALINKANGKSVRATITEMAGYQNKYRSLLLHHKRTVIRVMDKLDRDGISYYNPYAHEITLPGTKTDLAGVLEKIDRLSGEEKEVLLRKILL